MANNALKNNTQPGPENIERYFPDSSYGLNAAQVEARRAQGLTNRPSAGHGKSYAQIVRENVLTLFNLLNLALALCVIFVGSYRNALFMGVIICNTVVGIVQEVRA